MADCGVEIRACPTSTSYSRFELWHPMCISASEGLVGARARWRLEHVMKISLFRILGAAVAYGTVNASELPALDVPAPFTLRMALAESKPDDIFVSVRELRTEATVPKQARKLNKKALAAERKGKPGQALELMEAAVGLASDFFQAHAALAVGYVKAGRILDAEQHVERAEELDPDYLPAREIRGIVMLFAGRYAEAADKLADLAAKAPFRPTVHFYLGQALEQLGDAEKARYHLDRAEELERVAQKRLRQPLPSLFMTPFCIPHEHRSTSGGMPRTIDGFSIATDQCF
jgi:tetratricopeptide (TPR) repeat protein